MLPMAYLWPIVSPYPWLGPPARGFYSGNTVPTAQTHRSQTHRTHVVSTHGLSIFSPYPRLIKGISWYLRLNIMVPAAHVVLKECIFTFDRTGFEPTTCPWATRISDHQAMAASSERRRFGCIYELLFSLCTQTRKPNRSHAQDIYHHGSQGKLDSKMF